LKNNWTAGNTDNKTPTFQKIYDAKKEVSLNVKDYIFTYNAGMTPQVNGIGSSNFKKDHIVRIDFRTAYDPSKDKTLSPLSTVTAHEHMLKMVEEMERIIKSKKNDPGSPFEIISPTGMTNDLSDRRKGIYRYVYDVMLKETNT